MFYRKISKVINDYLKNDDAKILCIEGARQVGKTYIIRELGSRKYSNYIEINFANDFNGPRKYERVDSVESFYMQLGVEFGDQLVEHKTLIFLDEIQVYPKFLTMLKPLRQDNRFKYICSGSELGLAMTKTTLIPMGSISEEKMYPMDFEEFLLANSVGKSVIEHMKQCFINKVPLSESIHNQILHLFKVYLFVGGLPEAVKAYIETTNVFEIAKVQNLVIEHYKQDAAKYDMENRLKIHRIYDLVPSNLENKVKRIQYNKIEDKDYRFEHYQDEFDYLISSGIVLDTKAISEPKFPLIQSSSKNLIKLYMNDVGLLTNILYKTNINAILDDKKGINLGAVYETLVAQELMAHGHKLFYFDQKKMGEVDFLVDDYDNLSILPIEVKSGMDGYRYRALPKLVNIPNYRIKQGIILSNNREIKIEDKIIKMPIYFVMFI